MEIRERMSIFADGCGGENKRIFEIKKQMLSKILSKADCAKCRYCCKFNRDDCWELPLFKESEVNKLSDSFPEAVFVPMENGCYYVDLASDNITNCPFLSEVNGCELTDEDKPFDCKIWPLRVMMKEGALVLVLEQDCPIVNRFSLNDIRRFVIENGIVEKCVEYAHNDMVKIKEYRNNYPVVMPL